MPSLSSLGFGPFFQTQIQLSPAGRFARVTAGHRGEFEVLCEHGSARARPSGRLLREGRAPVTGDWVVIEGERITRRLDAKTELCRQAAGRRTERQVIAANVDTVLVVSALTQELKPRRIERYLAAIEASGANASIVLNKADLCADPESIVQSLAPVSQHRPVHVVSCEDRSGMETLAETLSPGQTIGLVGSSGVGKSTLVNTLIGHDLQTTQAVRQDDQRGRHTTSHGELFILPSGALLIDTPGLRELQLWQGDLESVFTDIEDAAARCRFSDCSHDSEPGCAVRAAIDSGELSGDRMASYDKLAKERQANSERQDTFAYRQSRRKLARMIKNAKTNRRNKRGGYD